MAEQLLLAGGRGNAGFLLTQEEYNALWENLPEGSHIGYMGDLLERRLSQLTSKHYVLYSWHGARTWEELTAFFSQSIRFEVSPILTQIFKDEVLALQPRHCKKWGHWWASGDFPLQKANAQGNKFGVWMRIEEGYIEFIGRGVEAINKDADFSTEETVDSFLKFLNNSKPYPTLFSSSE